jgi:hypothetical protein
MDLDRGPIKLGLRLTKAVDFIDANSRLQEIDPRRRASSLVSIWCAVAAPPHSRRRRASRFETGRLPLTNINTAGVSLPSRVVLRLDVPAAAAF